MSGTRSSCRPHRWPLAAGSCVLLALSAPTGCDDHVIGQRAPISTSCLREPPLTWDNFGDGIIGRHCRPCHSSVVRAGQRAEAPPDVNFDTYEDVLLWADLIQARAVHSETMPPAGGMQPIERQQLGEWLRCEVLPALGQVDVQPEQGA